MSYLRQQGIEDVKEVRAAYVEGEGQIAVIRYKILPDKPNSRIQKYRLKN